MYGPIVTPNRPIPSVVVLGRDLRRRLAEVGRLDKVGKQVGPAPAGVTQLSPGVVVGPAGSVEKHAIDHGTYMAHVSVGGQLLAAEGETYLHRPFRPLEQDTTRHADVSTAPR
jgi:hypothetical protein